MRIKAIFQPQPALSGRGLTHGLRMMTWEGMVSMGFSSITTSGFLAAFALALGASNWQIGVLASLPFLTQPLQLPAVLLIEKLRWRKAVAVATWLVAQLLWLPIALIPVFCRVPGSLAVNALLGLMAVRGVLSAVTNCAWNSWMRDLVPLRILGRYCSRRLALATAVAIAFGLGAAFFVDSWRGQPTTSSSALGYTCVLLFGALTLGLASPVFMTLTPEPEMARPDSPVTSPWRNLATPLRDGNFRQLMKFLLSWSFASHLAIPFFAVYMLERLGMPVSLVMGLTALSQLFNVFSLRVWGKLADHFGSKAVLSLCASLYLTVIIGWTFTTMPERHFLTLPLLALLHIGAGIATAGVSLTVSTLGLKLAPPGQATAYLAGASLATNLGTAVGPLVGGLAADFFSAHQLAIDLTWASPVQTLNLDIIHITGMDFLFAFAFLLGLFTLNSLTTLHEKGEVSPPLVLDALTAGTRTLFRPLSSVPVLSLVNHLPLGYLQRVPGVGVALSVTAYELADAVHGLDKLVHHKEHAPKPGSRAHQPPLTRTKEPAARY